MIIKTLATCAVVILLAAAPASATSSLQDQIFDPDCVSHVSLTAPQSSIDALNADPTGDYQPASMTFVVCGDTPQQIGPIDVTFHLKGHGSFRSLDYKAAVKIKIAKADRPALGGLKSLTLNNQVQDPSAIHEVLAYSAFRSIGIPAIRAGYANLTINGDDYGLHSNVESTDDRYLDGAFPGWDHLYEPQDWSESPDPLDFASRDVVPGSVANFSVEEGDEGDVSDLTQAAAIMDLPDDADWWAAFQQKFDVNEALKFWALEYYLGDSDNYVTFTNNYFLVGSKIDGFSYLPWGTDKTFTVPSNDPAALDPTSSHSVVVDRCLNYAPCRAAFRGSMTRVAETILSQDFVAEAQRLYRVTAAQVMADPRKETTTVESCQSVNSTISFLVGRAALWENSFRDPSSGLATVQSSTPIDCSASDGDITPPQVTVSQPLDGAIVDTADIALLFDATDASGVAPACTRDSGSIVPLEPGQNEVTFECFDVKGNSAAISLAVTRDVSPPEVEITEPTDGETTDDSATLHFTATDDSGVEPTCDHSNAETVPLAIGSNTITVTCTDAVGRQGSASVTLTRKDTDPPLITDVSPATGLSTTDSTVVVTYSVSDDSGAAPSCTPAAGARVDLAIGVDTIEIKCTDAAGNTGSTSVVYTRVDNSPKVIPPPAPAPAKAPAAVTIDRGRKSAHSLRVRLDLSWPQGATTAKISNNGTFRGSRTIKAPRSRITWRLQRKRGLRGSRTVYVRFSAADGSVVARVFDSIALVRRHSRH